MVLAKAPAHILPSKMNCAYDQLMRSLLYAYGIKLNIAWSRSVVKGKINVVFENEHSTMSSSEMELLVQAEFLNLSVFVMCSYIYMYIYPCKKWIVIFNARRMRTRGNYGTHSVCVCMCVCVCVCVCVTNLQAC